MTRRNHVAGLFWFLSIGCLLFDVLSVGMWVRSYWKIDSVGYSSTEAMTGMGFYRGRLLVIRDLFNERFRGPVAGWSVDSSRAPLQLEIFETLTGDGKVVDLRALGFVVQIQQEGQRLHENGTTVWNGKRYLAIPLWAITISNLVLAHLFAVAARKSTRRHRLASGLCAYCGYDLRASTDICPECGRAMSKG